MKEWLAPVSMVAEHMCPAIEMAIEIGGGAVSSRCRDTLGLALGLGGVGLAARCGHLFARWEGDLQM